MQVSSLNQGVDTLHAEQGDRCEKERKLATIFQKLRCVKISDDLSKLASREKLKAKEIGLDNPGSLCIQNFKISTIFPFHSIPFIFSTHS